VLSKPNLVGSDILYHVKMRVVAYVVTETPGHGLSWVIHLFFMTAVSYCHVVV